MRNVIRTASSPGAHVRAAECQLVRIASVLGDKQQFVGLAIDDETQFELTGERIQAWCKQVLEELDL